jgi:hypothetical protein
MKIVGTLLLSSSLCLGAAAVSAQDFGALVELSFGNQWFSGVENSNGSEFNNASESVIYGSVAAGLTFGAFGVQLDYIRQRSGDPAASEAGFGANATTLHANYRTGAYAFGLFYGVGDTSPAVDSDRGEVKFGGVEVAANFSNYRIAGQIGKSTQNNDHSSLDYDHRLYGIVEGQYYLDNGLTLSGSLGGGTGQIHGGRLDVTQIAFGVSKSLGSSGLVGTAGLRHTISWAGDNNGSGANTELLIGLTMPLGGGSVREVNESSVSMIRTNLPAIIAAMTAVYD